MVSDSWCVCLGCQGERTDLLYQGVTALPLWLSYALFDFMFILVISVICTALILPQSQFWGIGYIALVLLLYGIAAMLVAYILSMFASSQPAACALAIVVMIVEYIISSIVIIVRLSHFSLYPGLRACADSCRLPQRGLILAKPLSTALRMVWASFSRSRTSCVPTCWA